MLPLNNWQKHKSTDFNKQFAADPPKSRCAWAPEMLSGVSFLESDRSDQLTVDWGECSSLKNS